MGWVANPQTREKKIEGKKDDDDDPKKTISTSHSLIPAKRGMCLFKML